MYYGHNFLTLFGRNYLTGLLCNCALFGNVRMRLNNCLIPTFAVLTLCTLLSSCSVKHDEKDDILLMEEKGPKWGFINHSGKFVIEPKFKRISKFSEGLAAADQNNRFGYIDRKGEYVIQRQYSFAKAFSAGYAPVQMDGFWGAINKKGDLVLACKFIDIGVPHEVDPDAEDHAVLLPYKGSKSLIKDATGKLEVTGNEKWGFHDFGPHGKGDIKPQWDKVKYFNDGLCPVFKEGTKKVPGKWGYINNTGVLVIDYKFDEASVFKNRVAECMMGDDFVWVDKIGTIAKKSKLESLQGFSDGMAVQPSRKKTFIYITRSGEPAFKKRFHYADNFSEGLAVVQPVNSQRRGYIDKRGEMVIAARYDDANAFSEQLAAVRVDPDLFFQTHEKDGTAKAGFPEEEPDKTKKPAVTPDSDSDSDSAGDEPAKKEPKVEAPKTTDEEEDDEDAEE